MREILSRGAARLARAGRRLYDVHKRGFASFRPAGAVRGRALVAHEIEALLLPARRAGAGAAQQPRRGDRTMRETLLGSRLRRRRDQPRAHARFRPRHRYDLFAARGRTSPGSPRRCPPDCIKVAHLDTAHWLANNAAVFARELALRDRRGAALDSHKFVAGSTGRSRSPTMRRCSATTSTTRPTPSPASRCSRCRTRRRSPTPGTSDKDFAAARTPLPLDRQPGLRAQGPRPGARGLRADARAST